MHSWLEAEGPARGASRLLHSLVALPDAGTDVITLGAEAAPYESAGVGHSCLVFPTGPTILASRVWESRH